MELTFHPLTPDRWPDLEALFGPRGSWGGCWCMWWRLTASAFERERGEGNRRALQAVVEEGRVPGILAYTNDRPVAWCSVAPRDEFPRLDRSPILGRVDDEPVWSVVCFYVARSARRQGVAQRLLEAAVAQARRQGATVVEGYPIEPRGNRHPAVSAWTGVPIMFERAGFREVLRRKATRPILRRVLEPKEGQTSPSASGT